MTSSPQTRHSPSRTTPSPAREDNACVRDQLAGGEANADPARILETTGGHTPTALGAIPHGTTHRPQKFNDLPPAQQAGIICNDPRFQKFAAMRSGFPNQQFNATAAAEYLRTICQIASRSQLNSSSPAQSRLQSLRTEFDAWAGKIATPR